jgi:hypothetical protein
VSHPKIEQYFFPEDLFPFFREDDHLQERDVVLLGPEEGVVEVETVGEDGHGLLAIYGLKGAFGLEGH